MGDHTRPLTAYDWTMHIPLIFRQPGKVAAGKVCDKLVSNYDFLPTVVSYLGIASEEALSRSPGRDLKAILQTGVGAPQHDDAIFFEFETVRAVRTRSHKLIVRKRDGLNELFDLAADPGERTNLYDSPQHAALQTELRGKLDTFFEKYADPQYNLWNGGRSKAPLHSQKIVPEK